jgi:hypothetical protein
VHTNNADQIDRLIDWHTPDLKPSLSLVPVPVATSEDDVEVD